MNVSIEVCVDTCNPVDSQISAATDGGADTIEICEDLSVDGLTPAVSDIEKAILTRDTHNSDMKIMTMIRPRDGGFVYSQSEIKEMEKQIELAAKAGADGVVFGLLLEETNEVDVASTQRLVGLAKNLGLIVTFHRAIDATPDFSEALFSIIDSGANRVLASCTKWGSGLIATDGASELNRLIKQAGDDIQVIAAGGVNPNNAKELADMLQGEQPVFLHAYSGAQQDGVTTAESVRKLVQAANLK